MTDPTPLVSVVLGSRSDLPTMQMALDVLEQLEIPHEVWVLSPHRAPDELVAFAKGLDERGIQVVIAGAGGAAHLPGMLAAHTLAPVLGVPVQTHVLDGLDSLLSVVQMPRGVPVGTLAIGGGGAWNAGILAASIVGLSDPALRSRLAQLRDRRRKNAFERLG